MEAVVDVGIVPPVLARDDLRLLLLLIRGDHVGIVGVARRFTSLLRLERCDLVFELQDLILVVLVGLLDVVLVLL